MMNSQNTLNSQSTMAGESQLIKKNYSYCGFIPAEKIIENNFQYVLFNSLLPMNNQDLILYMICLSQQLIEIKKRNIYIEELNLQSLKTEPIENKSYIFFLQESYVDQDLIFSFKNLLNSLRFNKNIYKQATDIEEIAYNLIRESNNDYKELLNNQIKSQFDIYRNSINYAKNNIRINILQPKNMKNKLYEKIGSLVQLITKPSYINCQSQDIVVKISENKEEQYDKHLRVIEILESFQEDINFKYYGYLRFQSLTVQFYKYYKQTFEFFQKKLKSDITKNVDQIQLIQSIVKGAFINIIQQMQLLHDKYQIIHRDLKPQNIMIDSQNDLNEWQDYQNANYLIIDFDCSIQILNYKAEVFQTFGGGTEDYIPPESNDILEYNAKYDIYQLGVIILETLFEIDDKIFQLGFWKCRDELLKAKCLFNINKDLQNNLIDMVSQNPSQRPKLDVIKQSLKNGL